MSSNQSFLRAPNKNRKVMYHGPSDPPETIQANSFDPTPTEETKSFETRLSQIEEQMKTSNHQQTIFIKETIEQSMQSVETKMSIKTSDKFHDLSQKVQELEKTSNATFSVLTSNIKSLSANVELLCATLLPASTTNNEKTPLEGGKSK